MNYIYKNLICTSNHILFDTNNFKIFKLDDEHFSEFCKLYNHTIDEDKSSFSSLTINRSQSNETLLVAKINMTNTCNMKCKYCFANEGTYNKKPRYLDQKTSDNFIKFLEIYPSIKYITFFGGEPLLNYEQIEYICEKTREINPDITFYAQTNGSILNEKIKEIFKKFNFKITLSVDGRDKDNDRNRIFKNDEGTFEIVKNNFNEFYQDYTISIEGTYDGKGESKEKRLEFLRDNFHLESVSIMDLFQNSTSNEMLDVYYSGNTDNELEEIIKGDHVKDTFTKDIIVNFFRKFGTHFYCSSGSQLINIDSDGIIYPCHLLIDKEDRYVLGDLNDFDNLEFSENRQQYLKKLDKNNYTICDNCECQWVCKHCFARTESFSYNLCDMKRKKQDEVFEKLSAIMGNSDDFKALLNNIETCVKYA